MPGRIVITGTGMVTAAGVTVAECWQTLLAGRSAIRRLTHFGPDGMAAHIAGEVTGTPDAPARIGPFEVTGRPLTYAAAAAQEAMRQAGVDKLDVPPSRRLVAVAGGFDDRMIEFLARAMDRATPAGEAGFEPQDPDALLGHIGAPAVLDGMERYSQIVVMQALAAAFSAQQGFVVSTACAGGPTAIGDAAMLLRRGDADVALAVGVDCLVTREMMGGFCNLTALSTRNEEPERASRPFDKDRDGFVMGEGAGALVLEREEVARARGATILAELAGVGYSGDAYALTAPDPDGDGMVLSMQRALDAAGLRAEDVDYINAHGTSTPANDSAETAAIKRVFGAATERVAVSGTKSIIGHLIHGAGAVGAVVAVQTIRDGRAHPTANLDEVGPGCELLHVRVTPRAGRYDAALVNAFGFGGQNTTLLLRRYAAAA